MKKKPIRQLIVTADDFGLSSKVNEAVVKAYEEGILTSASLMITAPKAREAIRMAKERPGLKVGLHLVVVEGKSFLSPKEIPHLVDSQRNFTSDFFEAGVSYFFSKEARGELVRECRAQIEAFLATGLAIDHLNSHNHFHIHPFMAKLVAQLAEEYKIPAVRLPWPGWKVAAKPGITGIVMAPWTLWLRYRLWRAGILSNRRIFGLDETGTVSKKAWYRVLAKLPKGLSEIYCHPATGGDEILAATMPHYRHREEMQALLDPELSQMLKVFDIQLTTYSQLRDAKT